MDMLPAPLFRRVTSAGRSEARAVLSAPGDRSRLLRRLAVLGIIGWSTLIGAWLLPSDPAARAANLADARVTHRASTALPDVDNASAHRVDGALDSTKAVTPITGWNVMEALRMGAVSFEQMSHEIARDWQLREAIQRQYLMATDPDMRRSLLELLAQGPASEVLTLAEQLLSSSDPARREDAYRLLTAIPIDDARARARVLEGLQHEADPHALGALVRSLQPGLLPGEDADPIATRLLALGTHPDPVVRAEALPQLPQWLGAQELEVPYLAALGDPEARVRAAAIAGIDAGRVQSPRLRDTLFDLAADRDQNQELRHAALQALLRFRLTRIEVDLYRLLQREVPLHPTGG